MGTTKRRQAKRNDSRQTAITFLTNITLGNEHETQKLPSEGTNIIEFPTSAQHSDNCISPTTPVHRRRQTSTEYGTLSILPKTLAAKGLMRRVISFTALLTQSYRRILSRIF